MAKVPVYVPRGVFLKGEEFREIRSAVIKSYRKNCEKQMRKAVSDRVNEVKNSIYKIIVTDDEIQLLDKNNEIIFES